MNQVTFLRDATVASDNPNACGCQHKYGEKFKLYGIYRFQFILDKSNCKCTLRIFIFYSKTQAK